MFYAVIALAATAVLSTSWLKKNLQPKPNKYKQEIKKTINELRSQAEELNNPSTYAAYSKLNRKVKEMEKNCASMSDYESSQDLGWVLGLMPYFLSLLFIGQYTPFNIQGEFSFWPLDIFLGYQEQKTFHLSLVSWYLLALSIIKRYLN